MAEFSDYYENLIIDHMIKGGAHTPPANVYVALFTVNTGLESDSPTNEVSGGDYTRKEAVLNAAASGATDNSADITFTTASADWGLVTDCALVTNVDAVVWGTDVHVILWSPLNTAKNVTDGDTFKISAGDLDVTIA